MLLYGEDPKCNLNVFLPSENKEEEKKKKTKNKTNSKFELAGHEWDVFLSEILKLKIIVVTRKKKCPRARMEMLSSAQNYTKRVDNNDLVYPNAANHAFNFQFLCYLFFLRNYLFTAECHFPVSIPNSEEPDKSSR